MTSGKPMTTAQLKAFFDAHIKDCTNAELKYNIPSVVLLALAGYCSKLVPFPPGNNLFSVRKGNSCNIPDYYNCTADSIYQFGYYVSSLIDFSGCNELADICNAVIDSPFSHCFIEKPAEAAAFCIKALPVFFELAFDVESGEDTGIK
ncbi:MAG: hypothetical protein AB9882_01290 [Ignavibacteriaceae bacterium]